MYKIFDDVIALLSTDFVRKHKTIGRSVFTLFGDRKSKIRTIKSGTLAYLPDMYLNAQLTPAILDSIRKESSDAIVEVSSQQSNSCQVRLDMDKFDALSAETLETIASVIFSQSVSGKDQKTALFTH